MIRTLALAVALVAAATACASASSQPRTHLRIAVFPNGLHTTPVERYTLSCGPTGGTVPKPAAACRTLARLPHPFAPVPKDEICAQIVLGPQQAIVHGVLRGRRIWARLSLVTSCQIDRWHQVSSVVPGSRVSR